MNDIQAVDTHAYVTIQGRYAVINEGSGYAIIHTQTKQITARNITSFLDCVKTLEYMCGKEEQVATTAPSKPYSRPSESSTHEFPVPIIRTQEQETSPTLDELDTALLKSLVSYFNDMAGKIRRYHQDHHEYKAAPVLVLARGVAHDNNCD